MHELQVTERILDVVLKHAAGHDVSKIVVIHLRIGELSDLEDEWLQRYFDYLSKDTMAENARLAIEKAAGSTCRFTKLSTNVTLRCASRRLSSWTVWVHVFGSKMPSTFA